uniref:Uncharacterized protein n=1 Tax=Anguilla anguilla TaxID=7936 RepID=A0A0E9V915_ANGAN
MLRITVRLPPRPLQGLN